MNENEDRRISGLKGKIKELPGLFLELLLGPRGKTRIKGRENSKKNERRYYMKPHTSEFFKKKYVYMYMYVCTVLFMYI